MKRILDQERLIAADRDPQGCVLMNMHKAKGKEFDGVVLVKGAFKLGFFDKRYEGPPYERSRRLLRVDSRLATIVRPQTADPLVDEYCLLRSLSTGQRSREREDAEVSLVGPRCSRPAGSGDSGSSPGTFSAVSCP